MYLDEIPAMEVLPQAQRDAAKKFIHRLHERRIAYRDSGLVDHKEDGSLTVELVLGRNKHWFTFTKDGHFFAEPTHMNGGIL